MSSTTIVGLWRSPDGGIRGVKDLMELHNSWGSAPVVWDELAQRYLEMKPHSYIFECERLWALWKEQGIPEPYRAVLSLTFDRAVIERSNYQRMARDIEEFLREFPPKGGSYANHWTGISDFLDAMPEAPWIGLHCTSVDNNPFLTYNEETGASEPIPWSEVFDLYKELEVEAKRYEEVGVIP